MGRNMWRDPTFLTGVEGCEIFVFSAKNRRGLLNAIPNNLTREIVEQLSNAKRGLTCAPEGLEILSQWPYMAAHSYLGLPRGISWTLGQLGVEVGSRNGLLGACENIHVWRRGGGGGPASSAETPRRAALSRGLLLCLLCLLAAAARGGAAGGGGAVGMAEASAEAELRTRLRRQLLEPRELDAASERL
ncbi:Protein of unknown function, partial [Gryllus bimaculatus]